MPSITSTEDLLTELRHALVLQASKWWPLCAIARWLSSIPFSGHKIVHSELDKLAYRLKRPFKVAIPPVAHGDRRIPDQGLNGVISFALPWIAIQVKQDIVSSIVWAASFEFLLTSRERTNRCANVALVNETSELLQFVRAGTPECPLEQEKWHQQVLGERPNRHGQKIPSARCVS